MVQQKKEKPLTIKYTTRKRKLKKIPGDDEHNTLSSAGHFHINRIIFNKMKKRFVKPETKNLTHTNTNRHSFSEVQI